MLSKPVDRGLSQSGLGLAKPGASCGCLQSWSPLGKIGTENSGCWAASSPITEAQLCMHSVWNAHMCMRADGQPWCVCSPNEVQKDKATWRHSSKIQGGYYSRSENGALLTRLCLGVRKESGLNDDPDTQLQLNWKNHFRRCLCNMVTVVYNMLYS